MEISQVNGKTYIDGELISTEKGFFGNQVVIQSGKNIYINGKLFDKKTKKLKFSLWGIIVSLF